MEAMILTIFWHNKTMKMRNNSKTENLGKWKNLKENSNKNNNNYSNNNDLKDGQNNRLENKKTLIRKAV